MRLPDFNQLARSFIMTSSKKRAMTVLGLVLGLALTAGQSHQKSFTIKDLKMLL